MPSGSHGGGSRGGHSGGGSRGGSGGSRSGGSGGGSRGPRGPRHFHFGRRYYIISPVRQSAIGIMAVLAFFCIFLVIIGFDVNAGGKRMVEDIQNDYDYYQSMIAYAEANPDFIKTGKVTDKFLNSDCGKYYITYSLSTYDGQTLDGYTYSVYTLAETSQFIINSPIQLAVNSAVVTMQTDSITMDYKNMPIERDGEYLNAKAQQDTGRFLLIGSIVILVLLICLIILLAFKQKTTEQKKEAAASYSNNSTKTASDTVSETYCNYCGASISKNEKKCSNCGANKR